MEDFQHVQDSKKSKLVGFKYLWASQKSKSIHFRATDLSENDQNVMLKFMEDEDQFNKEVSQLKFNIFGTYSLPRKGLGGKIRSSCRV